MLKCIRIFIYSNLLQISHTTEKNTILKPIQIKATKQANSKQQKN